MEVGMRAHRQLSILISVFCIGSLTWLLSSCDRGSLPMHEHRLADTQPQDWQIDADVCFFEDLPEEASVGDRGTCGLSEWAPDYDEAHVQPTIGTCCEGGVCVPDVDIPIDSELRSIEL